MKIKKCPNQSGQITIEVILMVTVVVMTATLISKFFREEEVFGQYVSGPWGALSGMIQNGVWQAPEKSMNKHPNGYDRFSSVEGEVIK